MMPGTVLSLSSYASRSTGDILMRKFAFVIAAALAVSAPTVASAQGVRVDVDDGYRHRGDDHWRGYEHRHHDHGWHRGWDHHHHGWDRHHHRNGERVTVIKRRHYDGD